MFAAAAPAIAAGATAAMATPVSAVCAIEEVVFSGGESLIRLCWPVGLLMLIVSKLLSSMPSPFLSSSAGNNEVRSSFVSVDCG